jgi:arylformamidase
MFINISYPLVGNDIVLENGLERPIIIPRSRISAGKHSNTSYFSMFAHTGTHVDCPWHFIEDGKKVADFKVHDFIFSNVLTFEVSSEPSEPILIQSFKGSENEFKKCDCLLIKSGFGHYRKHDPETYFSKNPGLSIEVATYLAGFPNLRCIGMDFPSIENVPQARLSGFPVHKVLLGRKNPILLLEDANLDALKEKQPQRLFVIPLMLEGLEAAPVTAIVETEE